MRKKFIVDANVFVQGKNLHYHFDFCQGFWDWIHTGYDQGVLYSIAKVKAELVAGNKGDKGRSWAEAMPLDFFFEDTSDAKVMKAYAEIMNWSSGNDHYSKKAKDTFAEAKRADAFLLACAKAHGYVIVTQEKSNPSQKSNIPIPDAASLIGGIPPTITIYELLRLHAQPTFLFKP